MTYPFTDEHDTLRETARAFLQGWFDWGKGPERIYQSGTGFDEKAWTVFAQELRMAGVAISQAYGGAGLGELGRVAVMEELGASLCAIPFLTSAGIVATILETTGEPIAKNRYLKKIAQGKLSAAYCDGHHASRKIVTNVVHAAEAELIVMSRLGDGGMDYIGVLKDTPGLKITPETKEDLTRKYACVDWSDVAQSHFIEIGYGSVEQHDKLIKQSFIALAAESIGAAQKCLDMTLAYAEKYEGQQARSNQPIGGIQTLKQRCADMFTLIEAARSDVYAAAVAPADEKTEAAVIAKTSSLEAFYIVAETASELHDSAELTSQYPLNFFFKRAQVNRVMFGDSSQEFD